MSVPFTADPAPRLAAPRVTPQRIALVRAGLALLWAAALALAVGDDVPRTASNVPTAAAALLAAYPLIDVVASVFAARRADVASRVMRVNAAIGLVATVAIGATSFGADAGASLIAFGAWAAVSGALQLGVAVHRRREGRQLPMLVSGGLSTLAGLSFVAAAGRTDADLLTLSGYMAFGAILYVVWAVRVNRS